MTIAACVKWVAATPGDDDRFAGISAADAAAVEWALRLGEVTGENVTIVSLGPPAAEAALRDALAAGADKAVRIDAPAGLDSHHTAVALASVLTDCRIVWCGDYSMDRGSGSVPAFLAAERRAVQVLGIVEVAITSDGGIDVLRRLDGGRRERLRIGGPTDGSAAPTVVSVEGSTARIRRASLRATLRAQISTVDVVNSGSSAEIVPPALRAYRPRARVLPPPSGDPLARLRDLTDAGQAGSARGETVVLEPSEAADRILQALDEWGERPV